MRKHERHASLVTCALMAFVLFSCSPAKRIEHIYSRHPELRPIESDSINTWITYECDSFPILVPYHEISFDTSGIIPNTVNCHHTKRVGALTGSIDISKGKITFKCAEDSLKEVIRFQKEIINQKDIRKEFIPTPIRDWRYYFWKYDAIIVDILLLFVIAGLIYVK